MMCRKCGNEGVRNTALGKEFYYCRTCKEEIVLDVVSDAPADKKDDGYWTPTRNVVIANNSVPPGQLIYSGGIMKWQPAHGPTPTAKPQAGLRCPCPDSSCNTTYTYDPATNVYIDNWGFRHVPQDLINQYGSVPS